MDVNDFLNLFYTNLKDELDDNLIKGIKDLIEDNRFNKNNFLKLLDEEVLWILI